jgi:protein SSD1
LITDHQPEFGLEKRVHVDKLPLENYVYDEHKNVLSLYWTKQDVLSFLTKQVTEDEHLLKIKQRVDATATGASASQAADATALLDDDVNDHTLSSDQHQKSAKPPASAREFEGLRTGNAGHQIQDIREFAALPVLITADVSKSPPVLVVYACNPYVSA